jgi:hypothetical protein
VIGFVPIGLVSTGFVPIGFVLEALNYLQMISAAFYYRVPSVSVTLSHLWVGGARGPKGLLVEEASWTQKPNMLFDKQTKDP